MQGIITDRMVMQGMRRQNGDARDDNRENDDARDDNRESGDIESSHFSYSLTDVIVLYSYTCPSLHCYSPIRVHMSKERIDKQQ